MNSEVQGRERDRGHTIPLRRATGRCHGSPCLWLLVVLLVLLMPGCSFFRHVSGSTMGSVGWLTISIWFAAAALIFAGAWWGLTVAFQESMSCGLLFLLVPFYSLYYMFSRWEDCRRPFAILVTGWVLSTATTKLAWNASILAMDFPTALRSIQSGRIIAVEQGPIVPNSPKPQTTLRFVEGQQRLIHKGVLRREVVVYDEDGRRLPSGMWLWLPEGENLAVSLPCVLIAPVGSNLLTGKKLTDDDEEEHAPFVEAGFAVIAYELDGEVRDMGTAREKDLADATKAFWAAEGGLENARNAIEFALTVSAIDSERIYTAGHGSAGTIALRLAAQDARIKGCMAFAPVVDLEAHLGAKAIEALSQHIPDAKEQVRHNSPSTCLSEIECPVYLFHSKTDTVVPVQQSKDAAGQLERLGKQVTLDEATTGDHVDMALTFGIPRAVQWLQLLDQQRAVARDKARDWKPDFIWTDGGDRLVVPKIVRWTVAPDRESDMSPAPGEVPVELSSHAEDVYSVAFSSPATARAVILAKKAASAGAPIGQQRYFLEFVDLRGGQHLGTIDLPEREELRDLSPDGTLALTLYANRARIWSLKQGRLTAEWEIGEPVEAAAGRSQAKFVDGNRVVTRHPPGWLTLWTVPECHVDCKMKNVACMALSPNHKYLAAVSVAGNPVTACILDVETGKMCGNLAPLTGEPFGAQSCEFSRDGGLLATVGSGGVAVWNLDDGKVMSRFPVTADAPRLEFLGRDYLLAGQTLIQLAGARIASAYASSSWGRVAGRPDSRVWVTLTEPKHNRCYLGSVAMPATGTTSTTTVVGGQQRVLIPIESLCGWQTFVSGGTTTIVTPVTEVIRPAAPNIVISGALPAGAAPLGFEYDLACRDYIRRVQIDLAMEDEAAIVSRVFWYPASRRPMIGLRWGLGVSWNGPGKPPEPHTLAELAEATGPLGTALFKGLQDRIASGQFGNLPAQSDVAFHQIALLGGGREAELRAAAQRQNLDALLLINLSVFIKPLNHRIDKHIEVHLVDVASGRAVYKSKPLSDVAIERKGLGTSSPAGQRLAEIFTQVDNNFCLKTMPAIQREQIEDRLSQLREMIERSQNIWGVLAELRYYQAKRLVTPAELTPMYDKIIGEGKGHALATGSDAERRAILRKLLERTKPPGEK